MARWALLLAALVVLWLIFSAVDWSAVASALANLTWTAVAILVCLTAIRQFLTAAPLAVFIPGLGYWRALRNDTTAALVATVAPPPSDIAIRLAMFRSWRIDLVQATSGVSITTLLFYVVRLAAPGIGLLLLFTSIRLDLSTAAMAAVSVLAGLLLIGAMAVVGRSEGGARWIGRGAGRLAARVRPGRVEPDSWESAAQRFRLELRRQLASGWLPATAFLLGMLATEAALLAAAVRFAGVPSDVVTVFVVAGALLLTYPLTMLPMLGLGVMDLAIYSILVHEAGSQWGPSIVAGLIVWRLATMGVPLLMGLVFLASRSSARAKDN